MPKEKRIKLKTRMLFPIINPSLYNALIPAQYALVSVVLCVARDIVTVSITLLRYPMHSIGVSP